MDSCHNVLFIELLARFYANNIEKCFVDEFKSQKILCDPI